MRDSRRLFRPCLEWPEHQFLLEAQRLRTRTLWRWTTTAISRAIQSAISRIGHSPERGTP